MNKWVLILLALVLFPAFAQAQMFAPGNIIFADPFYTPDGQIVELKINEAAGTAEIINAVRWDLGGFERRRALGLDVDPNGNVWIGITATGDTAAEFPLGLGEALRIERDGTQTFFQTDTIKITFLAAIGPNKVIVNSNATDAALAQLVDVSSGSAVLTNFNKTSHGEALKLPDGRILMGDNGNSGILIYEETGGGPVGKFYDDGRTIRSLTYSDEIGAIVASLQNERTLLRIGMDGILQEEYDAAADDFTGLWGVAQIPGTTKVIVGSHNIAKVYNEMAIYNALNLAEPPTVIEITGGFEAAGLPADHVFRSFFNIAVVPEITDIPAWELY
ncbi:MAG: hypothetical protein C4527_16475 [Candidatus Omnitrophota bacterium]|jgi:hypothetical protein|nr:MAG: hypothetical protein C4527_16475 [Candidatus Omnitrophota bacterium]